VISRALAKYLDARSLASYRPDGGGNVFLEHLPESPDAALQVFSTGGNPLPAAATFGYDEPTLQLMCRGAVGDAEGPLAWAWSLYGALQGLRYVALDEGGVDEAALVLCSFAQTGPVGIGTDARGRYRYVLNPALHVRALTEHRD
jgi:hypothetical protein